MKNEKTNNSYLPVAWEHRETVADAIEQASEGKIFFFNQNNEVDEAQGKVVALEEVESQGVFVRLDSGTKVRLDRVITLLGKIGAAYDEYNAYANSCMDCTGGEESDN